MDENLIAALEKRGEATVRDLLAIKPGIRGANCLFADGWKRRSKSGMKPAGKP